MHRVTSCFFALAMTSMAAHAQSQSVDVFEDLCVGEQVYTKPDLLSRRFQDATQTNFVLPSLDGYKLTRKQEWLLNPEATNDNQLILVIGATDVSSREEVGFCMIFASRIDLKDVEADFLDRGAEYEDKYLFMNGPKHLWDIRFRQDDIRGFGMIIGRTNPYDKAPPQ